MNLLELSTLVHDKKECVTHRSMIDNYLCEFMWRTKFRELNLFDKILADISEFSAEFHQ